MVFGSRNRRFRISSLVNKIQVTTDGFRPSEGAIGYSLGTLAKMLKLEVSYTVISSFERGTREPDLLLLLKYARLLGTSIDVLVDDKVKLRT